MVCCLPADGFSRILAACPNLRVLSYAAGHLQRSDGSAAEQFTPLEAARAIAVHAPGLRQLRLCFARAYREALDADGLLGLATGGTLATLGGLRVLKLDLRCVVPNLDRTARGTRRCRH